MYFLFPVLAAFIQTGSVVLDKVTLSIKQVSFKTYLGISFPVIFLVNLAIFLIFKPPLSLGLFSGNLGWLLLASIGITIGTNILSYRALDHDQVLEIQTVGLLRNFPIIILASIFFSDERNLLLLVLSIIATGAVFWSHLNHHHFSIKKDTLPFLIWSVTAMPVNVLIAKELLFVWNPISLELIRTTAFALVFMFLFYKSAQKTPSKAWLPLIITNAFAAIAWILIHFGYKYIGIIHTHLLFSLHPLLVYLSSVFILKEPVHIKKTVAFFVVVATIILSGII